jgi:transcription elongation factor SPT5
VFQACKGLSNIFFGQKITLVPIREMTDVLSVESKAIDLARDTWIRMKIGTYKGDLAKVCTVFMDIHHSISILNLSPNLYPFNR